MHPDTLGDSRLILHRPDDWHVHLRDGAVMRTVLRFTADTFGRGLIMPNLKPPVVTAADADAYRARILAALPPQSDFTPLMAVYLTDRTDPDDLASGYRDGVIFAAKLYPANATTNSEAGVTDIRRLDPVFARMADIGMSLSIHGEATDPAVDIFDREAVFLERVLVPLLDRHPTLKVVLEHATTAQAVALVRERAAAGQRIAATITAHHLLINRTHIFQGGLRPHLYCLPIAKREEHRQALVAAATSGDACFFLGTDTAPHPASAKESACGCAGCFTAPTALELYAEAFAVAGALDRLEAFASLNGPAFHGLAPNAARVALQRTETVGPAPLVLENGETILPFRSGEPLTWTCLGEIE